jgi:hypothetical protein
MELTSQKGEGTMAAATLTTGSGIPTSHISLPLPVCSSSLPQMATLNGGGNDTEEGSSGA